MAGLVARYMATNPSRSQIRNYANWSLNWKLLDDSFLASQIDIDYLHTMTKQHFIALAEEIRSISNLDARKEAAEAVARVEFRFNARFDANRFYAACGL